MWFVLKMVIIVMVAMITVIVGDKNKIILRIFNRIMTVVV